MTSKKFNLADYQGNFIPHTYFEDGELLPVILERNGEEIINYNITVGNTWYRTKSGFTIYRNGYVSEHKHNL